MTLVRPNARGSDCPSESPCPTTSTSTSTSLPKGFWSPSPLVSPEGSEIGQSRAGHPRDVMVSATRIDTDLTTIEHLDWEPALKCEHSQHDQSRGSHRGPAWVLVDIHCPHCSQAARFAFCERWWNHSGAHGVTCVVCREYVSRDDMYRVVRWLP